MRLERLALCGEGMNTALAPVGGKTPYIIAGVRNNLLCLASTTLVRQWTEDGAHEGLVTSIAASPLSYQRPRFASAGLDGVLRVWEIQAKGKLSLLATGTLRAPINDITWSAPAGGPSEGRGGTIAAALQDGTVAVIPPKRKDPLFLRASVEPIYSVSWFPDGVHLASGGEDGVLRVFKLPEGEQAEGGLVNHYNAIKRVRVSSCGRFIAFVSEDEKGLIFDLSQRTTRAFGEAGDAVTSIAWHPTEAVLCGGTARGHGYRFDVLGGSYMQTTTTHLHPVEAATFCPDFDRELVTGSRDGTYFRWAPGTDQLVLRKKRESVFRGYVLSVAWVEDKQVVAGYSNGAVIRWSENDKGWLPSALEKTHTKPVYSVAVSPDGKSVATGSVDKTIKVWDLESGLRAHDLKELHDKPIYGVAYSPDGRYVATGSADTYLVVYDIEALKKASKEAFGPDEYWHFTVRNKILNCVAWSPDGSKIVVGLSNHDVVVLPVSQDGAVSKGPTLKGHEDSVSCVAWIDDERFVSAGYDRRLIVWNAASYRPIRERVVDHDEPIQALAVHPSRRFLTTGSWDATIRVWDTTTLAEIHKTTCPHFSAVEGLAFSASGELLASASSDGTVGIWLVEEFDG